MDPDGVREFRSRGEADEETRRLLLSSRLDRLRCVDDVVVVVLKGEEKTRSGRFCRIEDFILDPRGTSLSLSESVNEIENDRSPHQPCSEVSINLALEEVVRRKREKIQNDSQMQSIIEMP